MIHFISRIISNWRDSKQNSKSLLNLLCSLSTIMHNEYHLNDHFHWFGYLYGENELRKNLQVDSCLSMLSYYQNTISVLVDNFRQSADMIAMLNKCIVMHRSSSMYMCINSVYCRVSLCIFALLDNLPVTLHIHWIWFSGFAFNCFKYSDNN